MGFLDLLKRGFFYNSDKFVTDKDDIVRRDKDLVKKFTEISEELNTIAMEEIISNAETTSSTSNKEEND